jgi:chromate reductase
MNVCVLVGSLRKASLNGMLANALMSLAPPSLKLEIVEIGQLPFQSGSGDGSYAGAMDRVPATRQGR